MKAASGEGHIVNITASIAVQPNVKVPAVLPVLVKGGLNSATRAPALELAAQGVKVSAVAPGIIETPLHGDSEGTDDVVDAVLSVDGGATAGTR